MSTNESSIVFVAFCVKMLQTLSTETESISYRICRGTYSVFTALANDKLDKSIKMRAILQSPTKEDKAAFERVKTLFTKGPLRVDEYKTVVEQGDAFQTMRKEIQKYISFVKDVLLPLFSTSGSSQSALYISVAPMILALFVSSLKKNALGPIAQLDQLIEIAKLGSSASMSVKLRRLREAQRQIQSQIPPDTRQRPPDLIGEMIRSVEQDAGSSSTANLDTKLAVILAARRLV